MTDNNIIFRSYYSWWKNIDKTILFLILSLFFLGLFFSLVSTSLIASDKLNTNSYYFFIKHTVFICLAVALLIFFSLLEQNKLFKISFILFVFFFITLILVHFIGIEVKGSRRWMEIGVLPRFQPIEFLKPFFIIMTASLLSTEDKKNIYFKYFLSFLLLVPVIFFLISQPDLGQTLLIVLTWLSLVFISGINLFIFYSFFVFIAVTISYLIFFVPKFEYIQIRLINFLNPNTNSDYQSEKASEAIINGGFFGQGIGEGSLNSRIPEAHTDYIVSVVSEEFGVIVVIAIMLVFLILSYQIIKKINFLKEDKIKLILLGCVTILLLQTFIHIGVNIRILPTTGMTLPFLSYGGSSIVSTGILSGILLNLTKRKIN